MEEEEEGGHTMVKRGAQVDRAVRGGTENGTRIGTARVRFILKTYDIFFLLSADA